MEIANAEIATRIRNKLLNELAELMETSTGQAALNEIRGDVLKLLKDSEDRGLGSARQSVEHTGEGGAPLQFIIRDMSKDA